MSHLILIDHFTICFLKEIGNERNFIIEKSKLIEEIVTRSTKHHLTEFFQKWTFLTTSYETFYVAFTHCDRKEDPPALVLSLSFY